MKLYSFIYKHFKNLVLKIYGVSVDGAENEPVEPGFIVCANHLSNRDVVILAASLKTQINYLAKAELFKIPLLSSFLRALGAYPVNRAHADVAAIKNTISLLSQKRTVGIFPQGTRCPNIDPRKTAVKSGVGMIEYRSGVKILPVCLEAKGNRIKLFGKVNVHIGKPIEYEEFGFDKGNLTEFDNCAKMVFGRICDMLEDKA